MCVPPPAVRTQRPRKVKNQFAGRWLPSAVQAIVQVSES